MRISSQARCNRDILTIASQDSSVAKKRMIEKQAWPHHNIPLSGVQVNYLPDVMTKRCPEQLYAGLAMFAAKRSVPRRPESRPHDARHLEKTRCRIARTARSLEP